MFLFKFGTETNSEAFYISSTKKKKKNARLRRCLESRLIGGDRGTSDSFEFLLSLRIKKFNTVNEGGNAIVFSARKQKKKMTCY